MTLENRLRSLKLICIFKIMNGLTPDYLSDRTDYTLRNAHNVDIVDCCTELFASFFIPSAVSLWNERPDDIKSKHRFQFLNLTFYSVSLCHLYHDTIV